MGLHPHQKNRKEGGNNMISSESMKNLTKREQVELQKQIQGMSPDDLKVFRNSFDPDEMGFDGEEGVTDGD